MTRSSLDDHPVILFDGVCNFCNASVQLVIRNDSGRRFKFCAIQSDIGQKLMKDYGLENSGLSSMILLQNGRAYRKSGAALRIAKQLDRLWPLLYVFIIIPRPLRDKVYDFIGNRRYRWFGKRETCWVPDEALKARFLDLTKT
jgi:predicted DCC family thiol-disulfide oxidoreductase YuxK